MCIRDRVRAARACVGQEQCSAGSQCVLTAAVFCCSTLALRGSKLPASSWHSFALGSQVRKHVGPLGGPRQQRAMPRM
eukprot:10027033-Alexandrium_andersonii.AAC.1